MITDFHRLNLNILADFLDTAPIEKHFDMDSFMYNDVEGESLSIYDNITPNKCGTTACAVGWAPTAGVKVLPQDDTWTGYALRAFGTGAWDPSFKYLFGDHNENCPRAAAARIRTYLESGVPE